MRFLLICSLLVGTVACGTQSISLDSNIPSGSPPVVFEINPSSAPAGTMVTISGLGYSIVPPENAVHFGDTVTLAETYDIVGGAEQITFTVPADATVGSFNLLVTVLGEPSNADLIFDVLP